VATRREALLLISEGRELRAEPQPAMEPPVLQRAEEEAVGQIQARVHQLTGLVEPEQSVQPG